MTSFPPGILYLPLSKAYRGRIEVDERCIGCDACARGCPLGVISSGYEDLFKVIRFHLAGCTFCTRCAQICPTHAITVVQEEFGEGMTHEQGELIVRLPAVRCIRCSRPFLSEAMLEQMKRDLATKLPMEEEVFSYLYTCPQCKRWREGVRMALSLP